MMKNINRISFFLFIFFAQIVLASDSETDLPIESKGVFKVGLELQEGCRLSSGNPSEEAPPIYDYNPSLLKQPIFILKKIETDKKLLKIELDGQDIEFITYPFSGEDREKIFTGLELIKFSCDALKNCFDDFIERYIKFSIERQNTKKEVQTLEKKLFQDGLSDDENITYEEAKKSLEKGADDLFPTFFMWRTKIQETLKESSYEIVQENLYDTLKDTPIFIKRSRLRLSELDDFLESYINCDDAILKTAFNETDFLKSYRDWIPLFQPQVTVQLPLKNVIFFLFTLFKDKKQILQGNFLPCFPGGDNLGCLQGDLNPLKRLPIDITPYIQDRDSKKGLLFLHALTFYRLTQLSQTANFQQFHQDFQEHAQVDAKSLLFIVSRRPFNEMWQQIRKEEEFYSLKDQISNKLFSTKINLETFMRFDYGIKFLTERGRRDISFLEKDMSFQRNSNIKFLLEKGILTLSMICDLDRDNNNFWQEYYDNACNLNRDDYQRYHIQVGDEGGYKIDRAVVKYDALSPPWFLEDVSDKRDAMGSFRSNEESNYGAYDPGYGEAIIEIRNINVFRIQDSNFFQEFKFFLEKMLKILDN